MSNQHNGTRLDETYQSERSFVLRPEQVGTEDDGEVVWRHQVHVRPRGHLGHTHQHTRAAVRRSTNLANFCGRALVQGDHSPDTLKFPDISLTCFKFPDISRFPRQVVTLLVRWVNRPIKSLNHDTRHFWRHDSDDKKWQTTRTPTPFMLLYFLTAKQHKKRTVWVRRWLLICWSCICFKVNWSAYFGV